MSVVAKPRKKESLWLNLIFNIALPSLILSKASGEAALGPVGGLVAALAFPIGYGIYDFVQRRKTNLVSVLGFVSILATGGLGLLKLSPLAFALKEAAVPAVIACMVLVTNRSKRPMVKEFLLNEEVIDVAKVEAALDQRSARPAFEKHLRASAQLLSFGFLVSAALNYGLARYLLKSEPGTEAFNGELARMNLLSWPVIVVPSLLITMYALWRLLKGLRELTGLDFEELFHPKS